MRKKVFITGATGFIGSNIVLHLVSKKDYDVHIIHRSTSELWRIKDVLPLITSHVVDITDLKTLTRIICKVKPNIIFHFANIGVYDGHERDQETMLKVNLLGTINLIQAAHTVPYEVFINTGSSSEYGAKEKIMSEDDFCEPQGIYAITKLAATLYARDYARKVGKPIVTLRLFTPYGQYDHDKRLVPYLIESILKKQKIFLNKKYTVRDFVYIDDVVDAYFKTVKYKKNIAGEIINIGSGIQTSVEDIVKILQKVTKNSLDISWNNKIIRYESNVWRANITKAKNLIKWSPQYKIRDGLEKTYTLYKNNYKIKN